MRKVSLFASGSGTNVENIINYFKDHESIKIDSVYTNNQDAYVIKRCRRLNVDSYTFNRFDLYESDNVISVLRERQVDFIALAGFLWLLPQTIINLYPNRIINIHPALLPKYGGQGMYGKKVHEAVINNGETESGITVHYINEKYDDGDIIFQANCEVLPDDTPDSLAERVHELEYAHYPKIIEKMLI